MVWKKERKKRNIRKGDSRGPLYFNFLFVLFLLLYLF